MSRRRKGLIILAYKVIKIIDNDESLNIEEKKALNTIFTKMISKA